MHHELSNIFDEGIKLLPTLLIKNQHQQSDFENFNYNDYLDWLQKTYKKIEKDYPKYCETALLRSLVSNFNPRNTNILTEHQMVLKLILNLMKDDYVKF